MKSGESRSPEIYIFASLPNLSKSMTNIKWLEKILIDAVPPLLQD